MQIPNDFNNRINGNTSVNHNFSGSVEVNKNYSTDKDYGKSLYTYRYAAQKCCRKKNSVRQ